MIPFCTVYFESAWLLSFTFRSSNKRDASKLISLRLTRISKLDEHLPRQGASEADEFPPQAGVSDDEAGSAEEHDRDQSPEAPAPAASDTPTTDPVEVAAEEEDEEEDDDGVLYATARSGTIHQLVRIDPITAQATVVIANLGVDLRVTVLERVNALLIGATLSLMADAVLTVRPIRLADIGDSFGRHFWDVIGVGFMLWIPLMVMDKAAAANPPAVVKSPPTKSAGRTPLPANASKSSSA